MTRHLFIRVRNPSLLPPLIQELQGLGLPLQHIRVYGNEAPRGLPVDVVRWRSRSRALLEGAAVGGAIPVLAALSLGGPLGLDLLAMLIVAAALGGLIRLWWLRVRSAPLDPQRKALSDGELVISLIVDDDRLGSVQPALAKRHPELMILGSDPAGTPPFP